MVEIPAGKDLGAGGSRAVTSVISFPSLHLLLMEGRGDRFVLENVVGASSMMSYLACIDIDGMLYAAVLLY